MTNNACSSVIFGRKREGQRHPSGRETASWQQLRGLDSAVRGVEKGTQAFLRRKQNSRPLRTCWTALGIEWDAGTGVSQVSEQEVIIPFGQI